MAKASLPQGTRDFNAATIHKRNHIFSIIRGIFELYGFEPLETPAMENLETLMGKYGEEGDKLIFKILNNGLDNPSKQEQARQDFEKILEGKTVSSITERALRYDLTIPFARYVAMNHGQLSFPFKRYQVQPVWRADRPQKGRYREFYQCDADVVGSTSLLNELELSNIYLDVFKQLSIDIELRINSRKILTALAAICGGPSNLTAITTAIDKLDKIGLEKVKTELKERSLTNEQINTIEKYLSITGNNQEKLQQLQQLTGNDESSIDGINELKFLVNAQEKENAEKVIIDFTLARGLNYYTGIIFEVKARNVNMGSIGGGGRYDDLTGLFGVKDIPGVGISFGVDRIYDVMEEGGLFPETIGKGTSVLFFNLGEKELSPALTLMKELRSKGIGCELYHEQSKMDKQFKYADKKNIPFVVIIGSKELEENSCSVKTLRTGKQETILQDQLAEFITRQSASD